MSTHQTSRLQKPHVADTMLGVGAGIKLLSDTMCYGAVTLETDGVPLQMTIMDHAIQLLTTPTSLVRQYSFTEHVSRSLQKAFNLSETRLCRLASTIPPTIMWIEGPYLPDMHYKRGSADLLAHDGIGFLIEKPTVEQHLTVHTFCTTPLENISFCSKLNRQQIEQIKRMPTCYLVTGKNKKSPNNEIVVFCTPSNVVNFLSTNVNQLIESGTLCIQIIVSGRLLSPSITSVQVSDDRLVLSHGEKFNDQHAYGVTPDSKLYQNPILPPIKNFLLPLLVTLQAHRGLTIQPPQQSTRQGRLQLNKTHITRHRREMGKPSKIFLKPIIVDKVFTAAMESVKAVAAQVNSDRRYTPRGHNTTESATGVNPTHPGVSKKSAKKEPAPG